MTEKNVLFPAAQSGSSRAIRAVEPFALLNTNWLAFELRRLLTLVPC
jgi:hypothetical protein